MQPAAQVRSDGGLPSGQSRYDQQMQSQVDQHLWELADLPQTGIVTKVKCISGVTFKILYLLMLNGPMSLCCLVLLKTVFLIISSQCLSEGLAFDTMRVETN